MGQVMVYQPKFYYLVCPVEYDPIDTGIGYHLRKANYYVSEKPRAGFRLHPAFYDASGNEIDYFLTSAYEGSIYDASASAYLLNDEQVMNTGEDKFSSIAGARPASGSSQNLTRPNIEAMAQNRGTNWHGDLIKQVSAEQMLMIIEMGMMNLQTAIAQGVVSLPWTTGSDTTSSYAAATGSTASLGNGTGRAEKTTTYEGGVAKEYTVDGKTSVCWRGKENFWGNIWKFVYGINIWGNGKMGGGQPYICSDFSFAESKNSGNYEPAGFTVTNANGYISAMGYSTACDWLFIASECLALNSGAFISEIVKGALMGIDPGQKEAGASLGLTSSQTMLHLIIPPAFKSALPALFNQFITSVKDTALLSAIAVNEITHQAQAYAALSFKAIPTYTALAVFYLIILSILIIVQKQIERKMR